VSNWIKAHKAGKLVAHGRGSKLTAEQIEIRQLRAELARVKMERDILGKARRTSRGARDEYAHIHRSRHLWPFACSAMFSVSVSRLSPASLAPQEALFPPPHDGRSVAGAHPRRSCEFRGAYGWPRMSRELRQRGVRVGKNGALADAATWHTGARQAAISRGHYRQQP